jgi:hypothetical protein
MTAITPKCIICGDTVKMDGVCGAALIVYPYTRCNTTRFFHSRCFYDTLEKEGE